MEVCTCAPGCHKAIWPWSVAFDAANAVSWVSRYTIGSLAAAMLAACCPLVLTMVVAEAVDSAIESQQLWLRVIDSSEDIRTAALKWSALQKSRQQRLGLEEWSTLWKSVGLQLF